MVSPTSQILPTCAVIFAEVIAFVMSVPKQFQEQPEAVHLPQVQSGEEMTKDILINDEVRRTIRLHLIQYRLNLKQELGRNRVGGVGLSSGFPIELIDLVMQHLTQLTSVEKVKTILPV